MTIEHFAHNEAYSHESQNIFLKHFYVFFYYEAFCYKTCIMYKINDISGISTSQLLTSSASEATDNYNV